jgi:hypothetical protein
VLVHGVLVTRFVDIHDAMVVEAVRAKIPR